MLKNIIIFYFLFFFGILVSLILSQPDIGMTILISATFFCQLFVAGLSLILAFFGLLLLIIILFSSYLILDHVKKRINSFLDYGII